MRNLLNKLKIPTLLGLGIILVGIIAGVFLTVKGQAFLSQANVSESPQNITVANLSDTEVAISWQTSTPLPSFLSFGQTNSNQTTVLDDRDTDPPTGRPKAYSIHYVTIKNLTPRTAYQYKIVSGKNYSEIGKFETAAPLSQQTGFRPVIGSVLDGEKPLDEGVVYLSIADATTQSALVKPSGNFLVPASQIRKADLSDGFPLTEDTVAKLTILSGKGEASVMFRLKDSDKGLPPIKLGQDLDLTDIAPISSLSPSGQELDKYDINSDGKINAADNAIILQNIGNPVPYGTGPQNKGADLNKDGVVDQTDLDLMAPKINQ